MVELSNPINQGDEPNALCSDTGLLLIRSNVHGR